MMKRTFDFVAALCGLLVTGPFLAIMLVAIWLEDFCSPIYLAQRGGRGGAMFHMYKLRSMVKNADKSGLFSTAANDRRITRVGSFVRKHKLDEFGQLWNVLKGDMSLVGPRPPAMPEVALYTEVERGLLVIRPGVTDFASIVFADEGEILAPFPDAALAYNQYIRPWKNRLGLVYVKHSSLLLDIRLILITLETLVSRKTALARLAAILEKLGVSDEVVATARRNSPLVAIPPPGATSVFKATDFHA